MRLISWNVAGRVKKLTEQASSLLEHDPDVLALQEVTATTLPLWEKRLRDQGYHVVSSFDLALDQDKLVGGRKYGVLTATKSRNQTLPPTDFEIPWLERLLSVIVYGPHGEIECHNVHLPAGVSHGWTKVETFEGIYKRLARPGKRPRILCGDFNSPQIEKADGTTIPFREHNARWSMGELSVIIGLAEHDLSDVYRSLHGFEKQEWSWAGKNRGNWYGRRFDHVFASQSLNARKSVYLHSFREKGLSDHSPIEVCFKPMLRLSEN